MKDVLPHYAGKTNELKAFIRNPRRVSANYPPMPRPSLLDDDIEAVSEYLIGDYLRENRERK